MNTLQEYRFLPTGEYVRTLGRTIMLEDCRLLSLSGAGVEFQYCGSTLTITLYGDSSTADAGVTPWRDQARIAVFVDDRRIMDHVVAKEQETLVVFGEGQEPACHTVRILKLSEPRMSTVGLGEIVVLADKLPRPTAPKEKMIGFIGDSITCGYGIDAQSELVPFSTTTEDATKAYAYLTAQKLGADYSIVSYSGHGLISGYTADPNVPLLTELVQPYYEIFAYSFNTFRGRKLEELPWQNDDIREPDIIVINLGTNDDSYVQGDETKRQAFHKAYVAFLKQVHRCHPKSKLVAASGLMGDALYETEVAAVKEFTQKTGYAEAYTFHFIPQDADRNGYGADYHPSAATHCEASDALAVWLESLL